MPRMLQDHLTGDLMYTKTVDWFRLLQDLREHANMSMHVVAKKIGVPWTTVKGWYHNGCEPRYSTGILLVELYEKEFQKSPPVTCTKKPQTVIQSLTVAV